MIGDNPVLRRELLCAMRAPRAFAVLFVFVCLLSAMVIVVWPGQEVDQVQFRPISRNLFKFFTIGQFVIIALIAPAFAASSFSSEKERGVYELIYTSPLRLSVVILGKLMAAILFLLVLIVSSLPAMSACFQLGSVQSSEVLNAYVFLGVSAVCCGMLSLSVSVISDRSAPALMVSYLIVLPVVLVISFIAYQTEFFFALEAIPVLVIVGVWFVAGAYFWIQGALRRPYNPVARGLDEEDEEEQAYIQFQRDRFPENLLVPPRRKDLIGEHANVMLEKELRSEIFGRGTGFIRVIILLGLLISTGFILFIFLGKPHIFVYYLLSFAILVAPAFSSGAFSLERERKTLDLLLCTTIRPTQFVLGKFLAVFRFTAILTVLLTIPMLEWVLLPAGGRETTSMGSRLWMLLEYFSVTASAIALSCSVSMCYSMTASSTVESMVKSYVTLAALFVGSFLVFAIARSYPGGGARPGHPLDAIVLLAVALGALYAWETVQAARVRRSVGSLARILVSYLPLVAGAILVSAAFLALGPQTLWESQLGLLSPYLAAVSVRERSLMDAWLPSPWFFVFNCLAVAAMLLQYQVSRWNHIMYADKAL